MPKNVTSDWLIVTALTSVIGHVFTASANSVSVGCIAVQWTREESTHVHHWDVITGLDN